MTFFIFFHVFPFSNSENFSITSYLNTLCYSIMTKTIILPSYFVIENYFQCKNCHYIISYRGSIIPLHYTSMRRTVISLHYTPMGRVIKPLFIPQMGGSSYFCLCSKWEGHHTIIYAPNGMAVIFRHWIVSLMGRLSWSLSFIS